MWLCLAAKPDADLFVVVMCRRIYSTSHGQLFLLVSLCRLRSPVKQTDVVCFDFGEKKHDEQNWLLLVHITVLLYRSLELVNKLCSE